MGLHGASPRSVPQPRPWLAPFTASCSFPKKPLPDTCAHLGYILLFSYVQDLYNKLQQLVQQMKTSSHFLFLQNTSQQIPLRFCILHTFFRITFSSGPLPSSSFCRSRYPLVGKSPTVMSPEISFCSCPDFDYPPDPLPHTSASSNPCPPPGTLHENVCVCCWGRGATFREGDSCPTPSTFGKKGSQRKRSTHLTFYR